jgi:tripartite ATP-independent transporter DctP family solute receptor
MRKEVFGVVLAMFICAFCIGTSPLWASSAPVTITFAHAATEQTSQQAGVLAFKKYIEEHSAGRLKVDIYPNSQLGGDRELLEGCQEGSITAITSGSAPQVNFVRNAVIFDLPFAFNSEEEALKVFADAEFNAKLAEKYEPAGFKLMGASFLGFRATTSNFKIASPKDLAGMDIRTMENRYHMAFWRELGANPTPIPFNELYTSLQQGVVAGQENPLELIYAQKFYEHQKFVNLTRHLPQTLIWIMNKDFYHSLSDDLKEVVDKAAVAAMEAAHEFAFGGMERVTKELQGLGITIVDLSPQEIEEFAKKSTSTWNLVKENCDEDLYNAFMKARGR